MIESKTTAKDQLISKIEEYIYINEKEEELIRDAFKVKEFNSKEHIHWVGGESAYFIFVVSGIVHAYHVEDGKSISTNLAIEDEFISPLLGFITNEPSREYIQCLEDCVVCTISRSKMLDLYKMVTNWNKLGRLFVEYNYSLMADRVLPNKKSDKEKFLGFFEMAPTEVFRRIPINVLATFLDIHEDRLMTLIDRYDKD